MKLLVALVAIFVAFGPALASADDGADDNGLLLRVRGDVVVSRGETVGTVIVINGDALIEGTVTHRVLVFRGDAVVGGTIEGSLTVVSGDIALRAAAHVDDVNSIRGDLVRAPGATVSGHIRERDNFAFFGWTGAVFSFLFWIAMTLAVVVAGLVFAAVGGRQLTEATRTMTGDAVNTILGIVFVWVALPLIAVVAMVTLVGLPFGLGLLIFLLPALWFLGYIVAGARLGGLLVGLSGRETGVHPLLATFAGLLLLQLLVLVPVLGSLVALLAGLWGAGALAYTAYRAAGGKGFRPAAAPGSTQPQPAA
jgi:hypothetical protein